MEIMMNKETIETIGRYKGFNLASLLTSYPSQSFNDELLEFLGQEDLEQFCQKKTGESWFILRNLLTEIIKGEKVLDDIRSDYIDIFDRGRSENSLYETEYGRERVMAKTNELADLAGFYNAFGLNSDSEGITNEMPDHVSVELEFYSFLLMKQVYLEQNNITDGVEIVMDGRKKFLNDHLGRFVISISKRPGVVSNEYFTKVFNWVSKLVENECNELEVSPDIVEWLSSQAEPEVVDCALAGCGLTKT